MPKTYFTTILIIALSILSIPTQSQNLSCVQECKSLYYFSCSVCYKSCSQQTNLTDQQLQALNQTKNYTFQFKTCQQQYCARQETYTTFDPATNTSSTQSYCAQYAWEDLTQSNCINKCCDYPSYTYFNYSNFGQCQDTNQRLRAQAARIGMIVGIVFGSIFGLAILIILCVYFCKACCSILSSCSCKGFCQCLFCCCVVIDEFSQRNSRNQNYRNPSFSSDEKLKNNQNSIDMIKFNKIQWYQIQKQMNKSVSEYCSICLDGSMNCQTACHHKFHLLCFKDWIKKNADCPLCKSRKYNNVTIYCQKCNSKETTLKLQPDTTFNFMKQNKINCDNCI